LHATMRRCWHPPLPIWVIYASSRGIVIVSAALA
jgi:hypothetical protein